LNVYSIYLKAREEKNPKKIIVSKQEQTTKESTFNEKIIKTKKTKTKKWQLPQKNIVNVHNNIP
jgi:hypothetical protein